jgi:hypothetical protein
MRAKAMGGRASTRAVGRGRARKVIAGAVIGIGGVLVLPTAAGAQTVPVYGGGATVVTDPAATTDPAPPSDPSSDGTSSLPFTGGDVAGLTAIGVGAVGAGLLVSRTRRRSVARPS